MLIMMFFCDAGDCWNMFGFVCLSKDSKLYESINLEIWYIIVGIYSIHLGYIYNGSIMAVINMSGVIL